MLEQCLDPTGLGVYIPACLPALLSYLPSFWLRALLLLACFIPALVRVLKAGFQLPYAGFCITLTLAILLCISSCFWESNAIYREFSDGFR